MMKCRNCGSLCGEENFCPKCGTVPIKFKEQTFAPLPLNNSQCTNLYEQQKYGGVSYGRDQLPAGIISFIMGVAGIFFCGLAFGIPAIILGNMALKEYNPTIHSGKELAIAGKVLGIIGVSVWCAVLIAYIAVYFIAGVTIIQRISPFL